MCTHIDVGAHVRQSRKLDANGEHVTRTLSRVVVEEEEKDSGKQWRKTGFQIGTTRERDPLRVVVRSFYRIYRYVDSFCIDAVNDSLLCSTPTSYARYSHGNTGNLAVGPQGTSSTSSIDASQLVDPNWSARER